MPQPIERQASVNAGLMGAIAYSLTYGGVLLIAGQLPPQWSQGLPLDHLTLPGLAIALATGFLFGVAYRYTVRGDRNPHLWQGVVWAFSGVRTGASLETLPHWTIRELCTIGTESVLCFGVAALVLIMARDRHWLNPSALAAPIPTSSTPRQ